MTNYDEDRYDQLVKMVEQGEMEIRDGWIYPVTDPSWYEEDDHDE